MEIEEPVIEEVTETSTFQTSSKKHKKHKTTEAEEQILKQLEYYKEAFLLLPEIVNGLVEQLVEVEQSLKLPKYWISTRVRQRWYYRYKKSKVCVIQHYYSITVFYKDSK